jgi:hypothetical protein
MYGLVRSLRECCGSNRTPCVHMRRPRRLHCGLRPLHYRFPVQRRSSGYLIVKWFDEIG